jgi:hypothetical protein
VGGVGEMHLDGWLIGFLVVEYCDVGYASPEYIFVFRVFEVDERTTQPANIE